MQNQAKLIASFGDHLPMTHLPEVSAEALNSAKDRAASAKRDVSTAESLLDRCTLKLDKTSTVHPAMERFQAEIEARHARLVQQRCELAAMKKQIRELNATVSASENLLLERALGLLRDASVAALKADGTQLLPMIPRCDATELRNCMKLFAVYPQKRLKDDFVAAHHHTLERWKQQFPRVMEPVRQAGSVDSMLTLPMSSWTGHRHVKKFSAACSADPRAQLSEQSCNRRTVATHST